MGSCVCYAGVFLHQRTHLRTHSLQIVHICVHVYMCVCACMCVWMRMCVYDIAWHVEVLLLSVHTCEYACVCICVCMYVCVVYVYMYVYVYAHFVYLYCPMSLLNARVSQVFLKTCMRVCGGIRSGVCFSLFMVSACYWRGRLCFSRSRDRGFV